MPLPPGDPTMRCLLIVLIAVSLFALDIRTCEGQEKPRPLAVTTPLSPPTWALLQRELLRANAAACREFYAKYFDERGWLLCVERWGGDDGPDDAIENCNDWPILHALGGHDDVLTHVQEGLGRAPAPVHARQDDGRAVRQRRHVLQRIPRHVRLAAQRRRADRLQPARAVRPARSRSSSSASGASPAST